jgi:uncharacterized protein YndB with AHSA1/START domain
MKSHRVSATVLVNAPSQQVYALLADYQHGHPSILPKQYFPLIVVERGGIGAGTHINFQMRALGTTQTFRGQITEPEPGRVLVETSRLAGDPSQISTTTFTVDPLDGGQSTQLTITTDLLVANRIAGFFTTLFLRRIYAKELALIQASPELNSPSADLSRSKNVA